MRVSCIRRAALTLAAIGVLLADPALGAPKPDIIGDVVTITGPGPSPVVLVRHGVEIRRIKPYEYLYANDALYLTNPANWVEIEYFGGDSKTISGSAYFDRRHAFKLPSRQSEDWSNSRILRLVTLFPSIFEPPERRPATLTTPNGPKGAGAGPLRAAALLPEVEQTIRADQRLQSLPVVWLGGRGHARLENAEGSVLAEAVSTVDGFIDLRSPALPPGQYSIRVTSLSADGQDDIKSSSVTIPVKVLSGLGETGNLSEADQIVVAAEALRGPAGGRLQALADMDRLSASSFKAWAVLRGVARGDVR